MPHFPFKPFFSRAISTISSPLNTTKLSPTQEFTRRLLSLIASLSLSPNNPKTLAAIDSLLLHHLLHPLGPTPTLIALRGLSLLKKLTRAKSIIASLIHRNAFPLPFTYSLLLQCALPDASIRDVEAAWCSDLHQPTLLSDFIIHLCRFSQNAPEIERIYSRISSSGWRVSREAHAALAGAMNPNWGRLVLSEMEEPDDLSYFAVFRRFCNAGNVPEADSLLRDWSNRKEIGMDVSIYGSLFYGLCKSGKFREARKLFDKLTVRDSKSQIVANHSPLLKPRRRAIFQMTWPGVISETMAFEAYFRPLCSVGRLDEAERLLKTAMKKSTLLEGCVYNSFIKALFRAGRANDALSFFESERKKGHVCARDIAVSVIFGLCDVGRVDDGRELLGEMIGDGLVPTARIWIQIIKSYWEMGSKAKASELFELVRAEDGDGHGARPDAGTYSMMIAKFLEEGEVDRCISLLEEMVGKKFKAGVGLYSGVVRGLHKCGRVEESTKWLDRMIVDGVLVSYEGWKSVYDSISIEGDGFWKEIDDNYNEVRKGGSMRGKGR